MITGTYRTFFIMADSDIFQFRENTISQEPLELQTWLTPHFIQKMHFLFSVSLELTSKCDRKSINLKKLYFRLK